MGWNERERGMDGVGEVRGMEGRVFCFFLAFFPYVLLFFAGNGELREKGLDLSCIYLYRSG